MRLAVSNIAWPREEEPAIADRMAALGVDRVEIAPTKSFDDPLDVTEAELDAYRRFWGDRGIAIAAFQSMLFGRPDLTLFDDADTRARTTAHMARFIELAGRLGVGRLVFGSPKNRIVPPGMSPAVARDIAVDVFTAWGELAVAAGTVLCIEPNPTAYDCNFVVDARAGIDLVAAVDHPGFGLHLDAAGMTLAGDDPYGSVVDAAGWLRHFHASAPMLGPVVRGEVDHAAASRALSEIGYDGIVSIEMRPGDDNAARVAEAVAVVRDAYPV
ncbi:sugar phosphate isomerase/epimerase family protein [Galbitalea sp. SE-J8]|uniref:sugar phosphate isomerase/epimerase family protein n=1 Tax=Galbitalea sp. SE-J8 TaxID=3054952 RepID=UPI00259CDE4A|nr:sugar phosphate isomerase/epimerase family protein [Galbitalea sp. SE-J8]MDM4762966.1 sugar phosphate isomerase/epimerase family protein [Galbitalea sp. SE-J8]